MHVCLECLEKGKGRHKASFGGVLSFWVGFKSNFSYKKQWDFFLILPLRWDGDSPRVLYEGQAVPRGVREPRDGEDGEDNRDLLLLQLLLLQQSGRTARWAITEIFQWRNFIFCSDWTSSSSTVLLTACLTITITLTRLLSTLWALSEHNKTTKTTWIAEELRCAILVFYSWIISEGCTTCSFLHKNKSNSSDMAFNIDIFSLCRLSAHFRLETEDRRQTGTNRKRQTGLFHPVAWPPFTFCCAVLTMTDTSNSIRGLQYLNNIIFLSISA